MSAQPHSVHTARTPAPVPEGLRQDDDVPTSDLDFDNPTVQFDSQTPAVAAASADCIPPAQAQPATCPAPSSIVVAPGTVLRERYLLQQAIGSGGTSMIYRAQDLRHEVGAESQRVIAVKLLRDELREDARSIERLKREFSQMQLLAHPNVLKVFDLDVDRGVWFMTMELLEGQSLGMYLRTHRAPHPNALEIVKSCGEALQFAHERGIVHGDLKPGNIFLTSAGVRVLDFIGAADDLRTDRAATPAYASPQRLAGELPDVTDDIYSLGCVAYEVLTGVHPFDRKPASVAHELGLQAVRINSLSYRQWRALDRALAFDRRDRHASMRAFLDGLFLQESKPAVSSAPPPPTAPDSSVAADEIIPVVLPEVALSMPAPEADPHTMPSASAVVSLSQPHQPEVLEPTFGLRHREVFIQPLPDAAALTRSGLPPVFEKSRRDFIIPTLVALLLAVFTIYIARSDLDGSRAPAQARTSTVAAPNVRAEEPVARRAQSASVDTAGSAAAFAAASPRADSKPSFIKASARSATADKTKAGPLKAAGFGKAPNAVGFETSRIAVSERSVAAVVRVKRLSTGAAGRIPVHWRTEKRSAKPGEDYEEVSSGTLILQDGQRVGAIYVPIDNDEMPESDETFVVELEDSAASVSPDIGLAIVTIRDDDRILLTEAE